MPAANPETTAVEPSQLQRGLRVLELLATGPKTAASVARDLGVHRSTALRLLRELETSRYVKRNANKEYAVVAERLLALVPESREHSDWIEVINPILRRFRDAYGEATNFSVPAEGSMVYMSFYASTQVVAVREGAGSVRPMHCSAIGKAYLAVLDARDVDSHLARLSFHGGTDKAPRGPLELRDELDETRRRGYALDVEETSPGVVCVATAVRLGDVIIGAAGVTAPANRMDRSQLEQCGDDLHATFAALSGSAAAISA